MYSLASRLQHPDDETYLRPLRCHRMPSKLSCLAWNPDAPGTVTGGLLRSWLRVLVWACGLTRWTAVFALAWPTCNPCNWPTGCCPPSPPSLLHPPMRSFALCAVADYDGVLNQVDMESGHLVAEVDEHSGRRCVCRGAMW